MNGGIQFGGDPPGAVGQFGGGWLALFFLPMVVAHRGVNGVLHVEVVEGGVSAWPALDASRNADLCLNPGAAFKPAFTATAGSMQDSGAPCSVGLTGNEHSLQLLAELYTSPAATVASERGGVC